MSDDRSEPWPKNPRADGVPTPTQAELEAMFDADDADIEAGRIVPAEPVLSEMRATAARIRHQRDAKAAKAPRRA